MRQLNKDSLLSLVVVMYFVASLLFVIFHG